jgi:hypothetical protein
VMNQVGIVLVDMLCSCRLFCAPSLRHGQDNATKHARR